MHPIITAAIAQERHAELLRRADRNRNVPPAKRLPTRTVRVPALVALLRGWPVRG
jgi:hypothetical protein